MKLFPPDPEITLYETGFGDDDPFNRIETGKSLSELVERIEDPLVIALDGEWGCGKTWFLKRWVGAHGIENGGQATTVYFDAFAHDFMDEPLIALTGVIGDRLSKSRKAGAWQKVRKAAAILARPLLRVGLAAASSGATEFVGAAAAAGIQTTKDEVSDTVEAFWAREDGKRAAMEQLRLALIELTRPETEKDPVPLVVVVDELDRCRPDYALALLEIIKHFFSVPNVHFVLGVNRTALEHSVRARYGAGIDAERYLRRFISVSMRLPTQVKHPSDTPLTIPYFVQMAEEMRIITNIVDVFEAHLNILARKRSLTMRDMNQILSRISLMDPQLYLRRRPGWHEIYTSVILIEFYDDVLFARIRDGRAQLEDIVEFYGIVPEVIDENDRERYSHKAFVVAVFWEFLITGVGIDDVKRAFYQFGEGSSHEVVRRVCEDLTIIRLNV